MQFFRTVSQLAVRLMSPNRLVTGYRTCVCDRPCKLFCMYTLVERERNQWCESSVPLKGQTREEVEQYRRYERKKHKQV